MSSEFGTYRLSEQRRFRRACASAQSRQNLHCSLIQAVSQEEPSDRKPDPRPLWMAGYAVKICHDGMLEDTNLLDAPHIMTCLSHCFVFYWVLRPVKIISLTLSQVNLRWGENRRSLRKNTWPSASRTWLVPYSEENCQFIPVALSW